MINRRAITDKEARRAIELGEFDGPVLSAATRVAIVLTQNWCPQWLAMEKWLAKAEKRPSSDESDVVVFDLAYNVKPYGNDFMKFKEQVFGNDQVPYVRYYLNGRLLGESNYVSRKDFFSFFDKASRRAEPTIEQ